MENYGIITTKISHDYVYEAKAHWTAVTQGEKEPLFG